MVIEAKRMPLKAAALIILTTAVLPAFARAGESKESLLVTASAALRFPVSAQAAPAELRGRLSLSGAWALYPLVLKWAEEFQQLHPGVRIDVQAGGAGKGIADALAGAGDIGMVSRDINPSETARGAVAIAVAKDAVVPTISRGNPFLAEILRRGLKKEELVAIWITKALVSWDELFGRRGKSPIHVYTRSDACGAAETWAAYLGQRQEDLNGIGVYGDPGVAEAVKRDRLGIGFNNINSAYDAKTKKPVEGLEICPIDLDGNGTLDAAERIYASRDDIIKAIAANVYPSPPARELFFVVKGKPRSPVLIEFLTWALTGGQAFVTDAGYLPLGKERIAQGLATVGGTSIEK
jgi:phosphate transport system substrate-binding protein